MWTVMLTWSRAFDAVMRLLARTGPAWSMLILSFATGIVMIVIYRFTSNQDGIHGVKNKIKGHFLELRLFKDDLRFTLRAQGRILRNNLTYMRFAVTPMLFMIVPVVLVLIQMHAWFASSPLEVGGTTLVTARLAQWDAQVARGLSLEVPEGITVETAGVCVADRNEVVWRVRGEAAGVYEVVVRNGDERFSKTLAVGDTMARTNLVKPQATLLAAILEPGESPLPRGSVLASIEVEYKSADVPCLWWQMNWLVLFFILSIVFGFLVKGPLGVEI